MVCLTGENNHFMFIVINIFKSRGFFVNDVRNKGINQKVIVNSKNKSQVSPDKSYA